MAGLSHANIKMAFVFGLLGNIISFMVYLAPIPTFYQIHKKKSSEGFQAAPYIFALFSAMLLIYYAIIKKHEMFVIIINCFGCFIETTYITMYLFYAPKKSRIHTLKLILLLNVFGFGTILLLTTFLATDDNQRYKVVGWICLTFSVSVFAAPLGIMRRVIQTKSVEYMPFSLSFFLTLSAVMWFFYGFFQHDYYIAAPNILGFLFGMAQMGLYAIYRNCKKVLEEPKLQEKCDHIVEVVTLNSLVCAELSPVVVPQYSSDIILEDQIVKEDAKENKTKQTVDVFIQV